MPRQLVTVDLFVNPSFNHTQYAHTYMRTIYMEPSIIRYCCVRWAQICVAWKNSDPPNGGKQMKEGKNEWMNDRNKQACKQTKIANARKPQNTVKFINTCVWILYCVSSEYLSFHFGIQKKKLKQNMNGNGEKLLEMPQKWIHVDIRWPKTITHFTISFGCEFFGRFWP